MSADSRLAERVVDFAARAAPGADVEANVEHTELALTRFANSGIHQNVADVSSSLTLRLHVDGRTVSASTSILTDDNLAMFVERTVDSARRGPVDPGWPGVALPTAVIGRPHPPPVPSPQERAEVVKGFVDGAGGLETAGYCRAARTTVTFANSAGHRASDATLNTALDGIARKSGSDGTARFERDRLADIDGYALGARAAAKAAGSANPTELSAGRYEVLFEPAAVADVLFGLSAFGFNGKAVVNGQSFVDLGASQFDDSISIVDDPLQHGGLTFDAEGTPCRHVVLVDRGVTAAVSHDRRTAAEAGGSATSSGHASGLPFGPMPSHARLSPGPTIIDLTANPDPRLDPSAAAIIGGVERGVLVSDLWYTRALDPKALTITGLTRNGVWLVEDGEIARPLANLRFTQAYVAALGPANVLAVGPIAAACPDKWYRTRWTAPALRLASWNFTGGASG